MTQVIFFRSYQYSQNFISKYLIGMWDHLDFRLREFSIIKDGSSIKKVITYLHLMLLLLLRLPSSCNSSIDFKKFHNSRREINLLRIEDQDHFTTHTYYVLYKVFVFHFWKQSFSSSFLLWWKYFGNLFCSKFIQSILDTLYKNAA